MENESLDILNFNNVDNEEDRILKTNLEVATKHLETLATSDFNKDKDELYYYKVFANTLSKCNEKEVRLVFSKLNEIFYNFKLNELLDYDKIYTLNKQYNTYSDTNEIFINILNSIALTIIQYSFNNLEEYNNIMKNHIGLLTMGENSANIFNFIKDKPWFFLLIKCSSLFGNNFMFCIQALMVNHDYLVNKSDFIVG